jgi:hypothetical protein
MKLEQNHYVRLLIMSLLSLIVMYFLMYSMINVAGNFYNNLNKFYMAVLMTAPMVVFEIIPTGSLYQNKRLNMLIISGSILTLIALFLFIRQQTGINDRQFLRAMIPHHSSAILMCEQANIQDAEIRDLCASIVQSQQEEINQMKEILSRIKGE